MTTENVLIRHSVVTRFLLWFALAVLIGSYICLPVADPDLWWHIVVGRWIVAHRSIPIVDYWNMFSGEQGWRAYSWSNEVILALIESRWGEMGLAVSQIILGVGLVMSLQYVGGRIAKDYFVGALVGLYAAVASYNNFTLRPQVLIWIFFAFTILIADEVSERGSSFKRYGQLGLLGCLWANTHLTAALGLVAVFLWTVQSSDARVSIKRACVASLAFFIGTLITPYAGGEWLTFLSKGSHPLRYQSIAEFRPATILQFSSVFVLLQVFLLTVVSYTTRALPTLARGVLAGGFFAAGFTAVKFLPFAAIVWALLFAVWWRDCGSFHRVRMHDNFAEGLLSLKEGVMGLSSQTGRAIVFLMASISVVNIVPLLRTPLNTRVTVKEGVDFIERHNLPHPILNEFGSGGYLMYRFSDHDGNPLHKVAIDGRTNVNPEHIWSMYTASLGGKATWRQFIDTTNAQTIVWRQGSPMVSLLILSPEWCQVFSSGGQDDDHAVFVKREYFVSKAGALSSEDCP